MNNNQNIEDEIYMQEALKEAAVAELKGEVPVGAVVVVDDRIVARAHNLVETKKTSLAHAEMLAIKKAETVLSSKWLQGATMYVTLEPCSMCAGALVLARIKRLVIGAKDPKTGACGSKLNITKNGELNHDIQITTGILENECAEIIRKFFKNKRSSK